MRIVRFLYSKTALYGVLLPDGVRCLVPQKDIPEEIPLENVDLLPVVAPTKIVCAGLNYRAHAAEMGLPLPAAPMLFLKPPSAVITPGQSIILPPDVGRVDFEGELALVMGRTCRAISPAEAPDYIFGYTCANDVTARDLQPLDPTFGRCKGFDTFCPIGPWIETDVEAPSALKLRTLVNGEVRQESSTADMIFTPFELVSSISTVMTLFPGDVILTGTPSGIGPLAPDDEVRVDIERVGILINPVRLSDALAAEGAAGADSGAPIQ